MADRIVVAISATESRRPWIRCASATKLCPHSSASVRFLGGAVSGPRMCFMIDIEDSVLCDVGVNLRGGQVAVTEQLLDAPEVGPAIQQVGREAMPRVCGLAVSTSPARSKCPSSSRPTLRAVNRVPRWLRNKAGSRAALGCRSATQRLSHSAAIAPIGAEPLAPSFTADPQQLLVARRDPPRSRPPARRLADRRHRASPASRGRGPPAPCPPARLQEPDDLIDPEQTRQPPGLLRVAETGRGVRRAPCPGVGGTGRTNASSPAAARPCSGRNPGPSARLSIGATGPNPRPTGPPRAPEPPPDSCYTRLDRPRNDRTVCTEACRSFPRWSIKAATE